MVVDCDVIGGLVDSVIVCVRRSVVVCVVAVVVIVVISSVGVVISVVVVVICGVDVVSDCCVVSVLVLSLVVVLTTSVAQSRPVNPLAQTHTCLPLQTPCPEQLLTSLQSNSLHRSP